MTSHTRRRTEPVAHPQASIPAPVLDDPAVGAVTDPVATDPVAEPVTDPVTDPVRLRQLGRYDLASPRLKEAMDTFAHEAAELLGLPVGLVSLVLDGAQYFAGSFGLDGTWMEEAGGTPVEWSFCVNAVRSREPYVVPDASVDPLQHDNPLVLLDGVRSYAGAPLVTPSGHVLGTCCTLAFEPREFTPAEVKGLQQLAERIVDELERSAAA